MKPVTILFARRDSVYKTLCEDVYDIDRDARTFKGNNPVVAHPPCRAWGKFAWRANPRPDEKALSTWAITKARQNGGVVEHPMGSTLWAFMGLPKGSERDDCGGFSIVVDQYNFGHKAKKQTRLYICGCEPEDLPKIPKRHGVPEYVIGDGPSKRKEIPKKEREETPIKFAKWLIKVAILCHNK